MLFEVGQYHYSVYNANDSECIIYKECIPEYDDTITTPIYERRSNCHSFLSCAKTSVFFGTESL